MSKHIDFRKLHTLFEFKGKLHEIVGYAEEPTVIIQPVRVEDYEHCECGRPLPNQQHEYVMTAPILLDNIGKVYTVTEETTDD